MSIKNCDFRVEVSEFAKRHFCKTFLKKYKKKHWDQTLFSISQTLQRSSAMQRTQLLDILRFDQEKNMGIGKLDFRVAGTQSSPKSSGNRVIFSFCNMTAKIEVLIVYAKGDIDKKYGETQWIYNIVKSEFPEYKPLI